MSTDIGQEAEGDALEVDDGFHVRDEGAANWVVRRIASARAYRDRVQAWAAAEMRRAEREEQFFLARFGAELEAWARDRLSTERKRKSISLPAGTVGFRAEPPRLSVIDEPQLVAWCRIHLAAAIRTETTVLRTELMAYLKQTGEQPPGTDVDRDRVDRFYIK